MKIWVEKFLLAWGKLWGKGRLNRQDLALSLRLELKLLRLSQPSLRALAQPPAASVRQGRRQIKPSA
jgi:hypothetical protein